MKIKKQTSGLLLFFTVLIVSSFVFLARAPYTEGEPIQKGLPAKYAIIIIDLQEDFILPAGKLPVEQSQARKIVPSINSLLSSINANAVEVVYVGNEFSPQILSETGLETLQPLPGSKARNWYQVYSLSTTPILAKKNLMLSPIPNLINTYGEKALIISL